jgi:hypothetical protein
MNKKPSIMVALGLGHPDDEGEEHDGADDASGDDHHEAQLDAANALIDAVHGHDAEKVVEAISTLHDLCANPPPDAPDEGDGEEHGTDEGDELSEG